MKDNYAINKELKISSNEDWSEARGRRKGCKAKGLKGKAFRDCLKNERKSDKGKTKSEKKDAADDRREDYAMAIAEGRIKPTGFSKIDYAAKRAALIPVRGAFMSLIRLNMFGFASKIALLEYKGRTDKKASVAYKKILATWVKFGGKISNFKNGVNAGKKKKPVASKLPKDVKKNYSNVVGAAATGGTVASATPLLVAIGGILSSVAGIIGSFKPNEVDAEDQKIFEDFEKDYGISDEESEEILAEEKKRKTTNTIIISVAAAAVIGIAAFVIIKSKKK